MLEVAEADPGGLYGAEEGRFTSTVYESKPRIFNVIIR
jgi:hypothetical protein